jgi:hypothetical protein
MFAPSNLFPSGFLLPTPIREKLPVKALAFGVMKIGYSGFVKLFYP